MVMILRRIGRSRHLASRDTFTSLYIVGLGKAKSGAIGLFSQQRSRLPLSPTDSGAAMPFAAVVH